MKVSRMSSVKFGKTRRGTTEVYRSDTTLVSEIRDRYAEGTFICFSSVGFNFAGTVQITEEMVRTSQGLALDSLFVLDTEQSWGNHLDWEKLAKLIEDYPPPYYTVGNSMGGYNAVLSSKFFQVDTCLSFAPQFSPFSEYVPDEQRWRQYEAGINKRVIETINDAFTDETNYAIFHGDVEEEQYHARKMERKPNIEYIQMKNCDHAVGPMLKKKGILDDIVAKRFRKG